MHQRSILLCALGALSLSFSLFSAGARAADTGFEVMARGGYGSAGSDSPIRFEPPQGVIAQAQLGQIYEGSASPYGGGFLGELSAGYRILPIFSVGLAGGYRTSSASAPNDGTSGLSRSAWSVGPYARFYLPFVPSFDPWVSIGIEYMHDVQSFTFPVEVQFSNGTRGTLPGDVSLTHHGVAVPLAIGLDYKVLPMLAIGPSFEYAFVAAAGGCASATVQGVSQSQCTDATPKVTSAKSYGVWSLGLDVRLTL